MPINPNIPASDYTKYVKERSTVVSRKWVPPEFTDSLLSSQLHYSAIARKLFPISADVSTAIPYGFFSFSSGYLNVPYSISIDLSSANGNSGNFTIEWFMRVPDTAAYQSIFSFVEGGTQKFGVSLGAGNLSVDNTIISGGITNYGNGLIPNRWHHCAVSRFSGNLVKIYIDGNQGGGQTGNITALFTGSLQIGYYGPNGPFPFTGSISNFRITRGTAIYSTNHFTPPTLPLSKVGSSLFLPAYESKPYADASPGSLNTNITVVGTAPPVRWPQEYPYGALTFDGTGSLTVANSTGIDLGAGDFTIEWFMKPTLNSTFQQVFSFLKTAVQEFGVSLGSDSILRVENSAGNQIPSLTVTLTNSANWSHYAIVRTSGVMALYVGGGKQTGGTPTTTATFSGDTMVLGTGTVPAPFYGSISNFRITKSALYSGNSLTIPSLPLSQTGAMVLLLSTNSAKYRNVAPITPGAAYSAVSVVGTAPGWTVGPI